MLYYYLKDESIKGPYKIEGLIELITSDTLVREESGNWKKAKEIPEVNILLKKDGANLKTPPPISKKNKEINITPPLLKKKKNETLPADSIESSITPPKLSHDTKKNLSTPPKINRKERFNKTHTNQKRLSNKTEYSSSGGFSFSWLIGIAGVVVLIVLVSNFFSNKSSNKGMEYKSSPSENHNSYENNIEEEEEEEVEEDSENSNETICNSYDGTGEVEDVCSWCTHNDDCIRVKSGGYTYNSIDGCSRCRECKGTGLRTRTCWGCYGKGKVDVNKRLETFDKFHL